MSGEADGPGGGGDAVLRAAELPEPVRARLVALVATSLPAVASLPPALRKVADFVPTRRARAGGRTIVSALDADEELRARVGVQVAAQAQAARSPDPLDAAAVAWLTRPEGWREQLATAALRADVEDVPADAGQVERLRERLDAADQATRELRAAHRAQVDTYKAEVAALRRKLGESRAAERAGREDAHRRVAEAEEGRGRAEDKAAGQDKELRRLRGQLARIEQDEGEQRRTTRTERELATVRARLLLDTIVESASGLRRELALPLVTGSPGDRVEGELASQDVREPTSAGSLSSADPALLEQYLALPRARFIVDGYNVSKQSWPAASLEVQRNRLLTGLAALIARTGADTTVVFDAAATATRPVVATPRGVKVLFSPPGVIADDVIRQLVDAEPAGRVVVVVTDDREVLTDVASAGARTVGSRALVQLLGG
jgi:predicted RNA-binding protein with PIN domain